MPDAGKDETDKQPKRGFRYTDENNAKIEAFMKGELDLNVAPTQPKAGKDAEEPVMTTRFIGPSHPTDILTGQCEAEERLQQQLTEAQKSLRETMSNEFELARQLTEAQRERDRYKAALEEINIGGSKEDSRIAWRALADASTEAQG